MLCCGSLAVLMLLWYACSMRFMVSQCVWNVCDALSACSAGSTRVAGAKTAGRDITTLSITSAAVACPALLTDIPCAQHVCC
jgi:hypothetical protein